MELTFKIGDAVKSKASELEMRISSFTKNYDDGREYAKCNYRDAEGKLKYIKVAIEDLVKIEPVKVPAVLTPKMVFSGSQEDLMIELGALINVRYTHAWSMPRFPAPLICTSQGAGLQTVINQMAFEFGLKVFTASPVSWAVSEARSGNSTKLKMEKAIDGKPTIVHIKGLHTLDNKLTDQSWFISVREEILDVLSYRVSGTHNVFFIGSGYFPMIGNVPILGTDDVYSDAHDKKHTYCEDVIKKFHSKKLILEPPNRHDSKAIIENLGIKWVGEELNSFYELGEVLLRHRLDSVSQYDLDFVK